MELEKVNDNNSISCAGKEEPVHTPLQLVDTPQLS